jgi:hypothetical protein
VTATATAYITGPTVTQYYPSAETILRTVTDLRTLTSTYTSYVGAWGIVTSTSFISTTATFTATVFQSSVSTYTQYVGAGQVITSTQFQTVTVPGGPLTSSSEVPIISGRDTATKTDTVTAVATREFSYPSGSTIGSLCRDLWPFSSNATFAMRC